MRVSVTNVTNQFLYNLEKSRPPPALASHARYWNLGKIVLTTPVGKLDWPRFGGVVAQLVERLNGIQEVRGSNPLGSTSQSVAALSDFPKWSGCAARNGLECGAFTCVHRRFRTGGNDFFASPAMWDSGAGGIPAVTPSSLFNSRAETP